ncbi:MAG: cytochrome P450 [Planctomycetes bacterium]|nr:cytochrome P450 [Planctomycetota bacterium]
MLRAADEQPAIADDDPVRFLHDPIDYLMRVYRRHGAGVTNAPRRADFVFALGAESNYAIYSNPDLFVATGFLFPGPKNSAQRRLLSGIFNQNGDRHRDHRRAMMPTFQKTTVAAWRDAMAEVCETFFDDWRFGETRDMSAEMLALVVRLNARLLLGVSDVDLVSQLEKATDEWMALNTPLTVASSLSLDLPRSWYDAALASSERVESLTKQLLELRKAQPLAGDDLLGVLLRVQAADPSRITPLELVGQTAHMFAAANQSTRSSLIWTLFLLAQHPEVMAELHDELDGELHGAAPTLEQIERLPLLDRVYRESVRLFPPVSYYTRMCADATELCGRRLNKGTTVVFSHYVTHHMATTFADPQRFHPDRWLSANPTPYEYLPFGVGARTCIGITFAAQVGRIALATLLQRARLTIVPGTQVNRKVTTILSPRDPMPMRIDRPGRPYQSSIVGGDVHDMVHLPSTLAAAA